MEDASYDEVAAQHRSRRTVSCCSVMEPSRSITPTARCLGVEGLMRILGNFGYPKSDINANALEEELLKFSNAIRLEDDLTFIEVTFL